MQSLLNNRAEAASEYYKIDPPKSLSEMLPKSSKKTGHPFLYILERTLMRPRDAILYLNLCVREATGGEKISWGNIHTAEKTYSDERLLALRDEWKDPYLDIDKVLEVFQGKFKRLSQKEIEEVFNEIAVLPANRNFLGKLWLTEMCEQIFAPESAKKTWYEMYGPLVNLMYNISFIGLAKGHDAQAIYSYEDPGLSQRIIDVSEHTYFEIHTAFRPALNIVEKEKTIQPH